jgi:hypothetical protein
MEVDFLAVTDGVLTVGEAKSSSGLGSGRPEELAKLRKYEKIIWALWLKHIVLATTNESWRPQSVANARETLGTVAGLKTTLLTAAQLLV